MKSKIEMDKEESLSHEPIFKNTPYGVLFLLFAFVFVHFFRWLNQGEAMVLWTRQNAANSIDIWLLLTGNGENPWQSIKNLIVHQFIHSGSFHLIMNSAMLLQIGPLVETSFNRGANILDYPNKMKTSLRVKGAFVMLCYFLSCGAFGAFGIAILNPNNPVLGIGASGAICGIYGGYLWTIFAMTPKGEPVMREILASALVFLFINVGLAAFARISDIIPIAWEAHLFGFIGGCLLFPFFSYIARKI